MSMLCTWRVLPMVVALGALAGCAGLERSGEERAEQARAHVDADEERETIEMAAEPPEELEAALEGGALRDPLELRADEPRFDLTVDDVEATRFFQGVVEDTPYNVVVHPEVEGRISLSLTDVSIPEIMDTAAEVYGYRIQRTDTAYLVRPAQVVSRLYHLDYLNVDRDGESGTRVTSGEITAEDGNGLIGSRVETVSESHLWGRIEETVEGMLAGDHEDAAVVASPAAGTLAVRATPAGLRQVDAFVERLQGSLNRQVILEARIVEVELDDAVRAGLDMLEAEGTDSGRVVEGEFSPTGGAGVGGDEAFGITLLREGTFEGVLNALQARGDLQVLSSPRVSTLNNQKAVIKAGTDEFYQTDLNISRQTVDNQRVAEIEPDFEPFFSGIALDVTPQVDADGWVTLHVQPSVTEVQDVARSVDVGGEVGQIDFRLAQSDVRQSDSIVRARDGEMIVIGGLIEERDEERTARVPLLGHIPLLGALFTHQRVESQEYELVILLRPHVVDEGTWAGAVEERSRSLERRFEPGQE